MPSIPNAATASAGFAANQSSIPACIFFSTHTTVLSCASNLAHLSSSEDEMSVPEFPTRSLLSVSLVEPLGRTCPLRIPSSPSNLPLNHLSDLVSLRSDAPVILLIFMDINLRRKMASRPTFLLFHGVSDFACNSI